MMQQVDAFVKKLLVSLNVKCYKDFQSNVFIGLSVLFLPDVKEGEDHDEELTEGDEQRGKEG